MAKTIDVEMEGPGGVIIRFRAPANSTEEQLRKYALIEYQMKTRGKSEFIREEQPEASQAAPQEPPQPAMPEAPTAQAPAPEESDQEREGRMRRGQEEFERMQAALYGGGAGAAISAGRAGGMGLRGAAQSLGESAELGRMAARQAAVPPSGSPTGGASTAPGGGRLPIPMGPNDAGRMAAGQTGTMPYNYAKAAGLTDIEAARALDMTKQPGGVHDLSTIRREGTQRVKELFPGETYRENPRFGGIMTPDQSVGGGPRGSFVQEGQGLRPLPPTAPIPTEVPPVRTSGLEQVTRMFQKMMGPASTALRIGTPPLALAGAASEGIRAKQQMEGGDPLGAGLSGVSSLAALASLYAPALPVTLPVGGTAAALQYMRGRLAPSTEPTPEELEAASRPAFGIYPPAGRRLAPPMR